MKSLCYIIRLHEPIYCSNVLLSEGDMCRAPNTTSIRIIGATCEKTAWAYSIAILHNIKDYDGATIPNLDSKDKNFPIMKNRHVSDTKHNFNLKCLSYILRMHAPIYLQFLTISRVVMREQCKTLISKTKTSQSWKTDRHVSDTKHNFKLKCLSYILRMHAPIYLQLFTKSRIAMREQRKTLISKI